MNAITDVINYGEHLNSIEEFLPHEHIMLIVEYLAPQEYWIDGRCLRHLYAATIGLYGYRPVELILAGQPEETPLFRTRHGKRQARVRPLALINKHRRLQ